MTKYSKFTLLFVLAVLATLGNFLFTPDEGYIANINAGIHALVYITATVALWAMCVITEYVNSKAAANEKAP